MFPDFDGWGTVAVALLILVLGLTAIGWASIDVWRSGRRARLVAFLAALVIVSLCGSLSFVEVEGLDRAALFSFGLSIAFVIGVAAALLIRKSQN